MPEKNPKKNRVQKVLQKAIAPPIFTRKGTMIMIALYMIQLVKIIVELREALSVNSV